MRYGTFDESREQREWICNLINVFQVPSNTGMAKPCNFSWTASDRKNCPIFFT